HILILVYKTYQLVGVDPIDFVDHEKHRCLNTLQLFNDKLIAPYISFFSIDQEQNDIKLLECIDAKPDHKVDKLMLRLMDAGGIDENHLSLIGCQNSLHLIPRCLRFITHDCYLLADDPVDKC